MKEKVGKKDLLYFLNRSYYINLHLVERLDELKDLPLIAAVKDPIMATIRSLGVQLDRMNEVFAFLGADSDIDECEPMIGFLESTYSVILDLDNKTPYLSLLDHISVADKLMEESAQLFELSLTQLPKLELPISGFYDADTLQPLKALLKGSLIADRA